MSRRRFQLKGENNSYAAFREFAEVLRGILKRERRHFVSTSSVNAYNAIKILEVDNTMHTRYDKISCTVSSMASHPHITWIMSLQAQLVPLPSGHISTVLLILDPGFHNAPLM